MNSRLISRTLLIALAVLLITFQSVSAQTGGTAITINSDGSISPETSLIVREGETYILKGDVFGHIIIKKSGIILDGSNYIIQGTGSESLIGLEIDDVENLVIKNIVIKGCGYGLSITNSQNILLEKSIFEENSFNGIGLYNSFKVTISNNLISSNQRGIEISDGSSENIVTRNLIKNNNNYGILIGFSSNNMIYNNNFEENSYHVQSLGSENMWDNGYVVGGNYWDQNSFIDDYSGPDQDQQGSDGISDEPYDLDENNYDSYPYVEKIEIDEPVVVEKFNLIVRVLDSRNSPVEDVSVKVNEIPESDYSFSRSTDIQGEALFQSINSGRYRVTIEKNGYNLKNEDIWLDTQNYELVLELENLSNLLVFRIIDGEDEPITGVKAEFTSGPSNQLPLTGTSDEDGYIVFDRISSGEYSWIFTMSGYQDSSLDTTSPGQVEYEVVLTAAEIEDPPLLIPGFSLLTVILGAAAFIYILRR